MKDTLQKLEECRKEFSYKGINHHTNIELTDNSVLVSLISNESLKVAKLGNNHNFSSFDESFPKAINKYYNMLRNNKLIQ